MRTAYPQAGFLQTGEAVRLWYSMLNDISYTRLSEAVRSYIAEEHFAPAIADIRKRAVRTEAAQIPDWESGWEDFKKGVHRYGYMRESEALASMQPITAEVVRRLGYQSLCQSENEIADRAAFRDCYKAIAQRQMQNLQLPQGLQVQYHERIESKEPLAIEQIQDSIRGTRSEERTAGYAEALVKALAEKLGGGHERA